MTQRRAVELYTMVQVDKRDGSRTVIYGHATKNVIDEFRDHYVNDDHYVEVHEYEENEAPA